MRKFEALANMPFNISKGNILTEVKKGVFHNEKGEVSPIDPSKEPNFFKELVELKGRFEKETKVYLKTATDRKEYSSNGFGRSYFKIPAWTELKLVDFVERSRKLYAIVNFNGRKYEVLETELFEYFEYHFINSSGVIHKALKGRDAGADIFRLKSNNCFDTKAEAQTELDKIMAVELKVKKKRATHAVA